MDVALGRADFGPDSRALLDWCEQRPQAAVIAWHTVSNLFYLISAERSNSFARSFISELLDFTIVASGGTEAVRQALAMRMTDLEDALQVAAAITAHANYIISRNTADYRSSVVSVLTPRTFLARIPAEK
jgi:PIN domain